MAEKKQNVNFLLLNKYADSEIQRNLLQFHNLGNIHSHQTFHQQLNHPPIPIEDLTRLEFVDTEIVPFHHQAIPCRSTQSGTIKRNHSARTFSNETIAFSTVQTLLNESFGADAEHHRPYPSGGALYPISVFCCLFQDRINNAPPSGIYHYRPSLHSLQKVTAANADDMRQRLLQLESAGTKFPNCCLIYMINLPKTIVKYRYRGYRLAFMEVGSMYQQADLVGKSLGLKNKIISGFNDFAVAKFTKMNRTKFLPTVIQLFGK